MSKRYYLTLRDLHLYAGLFISPFILVFSVSVFFLVHAWMPGESSVVSVVRNVADVDVHANLDQLTGRQRINAIRNSLDRIGVSGEVGFIRHLAKEHRLLIPVSVPGRETTIDLNLNTRSAHMQQRDTGIWQGLVLLHKSPGPHLADIRMNWIYIVIWRWLADTTAYLLLVLSITGIYLWFVLKAERKMGLVLLGTGILSFFCIAYGLSI